jgi:O-antigen/teichoic acid export membrane protein
MDYADVKKKILRNSISNYLRIAVAMGLGLVTFRMLYQGLSKEDFGFWPLLWSLFGYGVLMDFGMGFAAQKKTAELSATENWEELSRVLSTIFFMYLGIAVLIALVGYFGQDHIVRIFNVTEANVPKFKTALVLFFIGVGLNFPFGIFPEVLKGQQQIVWSNYIIILFRILNVSLLWGALHYGMGLLWVLGFALFCTIAPDILSAFLALRWMPKVRISPRHFQKSMMTETLSFSLITYVITMTNLLLAKSDQFVLSVTLPVAILVLYQAAAKVAEIYQMFTKQLQETLSPAAAHLHAKGEAHALKDLLTQATRISVMVGTPLYFLCAFFLRELVTLLTGDAVPARETIWAGQILLLWFYTSIITHSVSKRIFVVTGHHQRLLWLGIGEAGLNLGISVSLVLYLRAAFGVEVAILGVCVGSLVPSLIFGWSFLWPWMARETGLGYFRLINEVLLPVWAGSLPMLAFLVFAQMAAQWSARPHFIWVICESLVAMTIAFAGLWRWGMKDGERETIRRALNKLKRRRQSAE